MLSYRHAFHAGNHADVLKHLTLFLVLRYFNQKDKPYWYIDTHSGAGLYDLSAPQAQKVGEYRAGIGRLRDAAALPEPLVAFLAYVQAVLPQPDTYCGSPWLAKHLLRESDRLRLFELHPADAALLKQNMAGDRRIVVHQADGYAGLTALLPPPTRRAVVLVDPPYEQKQDYARVVQALQAARKRFANGCYLLWYPCLSREESLNLPAALKKSGAENWLRAELHVHAPRADGFGMHGSGMWVVNPPYVLHDQLQAALPVLAERLAQDNGARYLLERQAV